MIIDISKEHRILDNDCSSSELVQWLNSELVEQHLYFTSPTVTYDGKYLVVLSERFGPAPELCAIDRGSLEMRRLTQSKGLLRSYTYPTGGSVGLSKASPCLDDVNNKLYWIEDDCVWMCCLNDGLAPTRVARLPQGWVAGYTTLSADSRFLCVPCADPRAFCSSDLTQHQQLYRVPLRMRKAGYVTKLLVVDLHTGAIEVRSELPFWVTHVQFFKSGHILCNSEGAIRSMRFRGYPYTNRIWIVDEGGRYSPLSDEVCDLMVNHENLDQDTRKVYFHGMEDLSVLSKFCLRLSLVRNRLGFFGQKDVSSSFKHFIGVHDTLSSLSSKYPVNVPVSHAVSSWKDGVVYYDSRDGYIYSGELTGAELRSSQICHHGSSMSNQDVHPHPICSTPNAGLVFSTDVSGTGSVYEVMLKGEER